jgi:GNAT superfamily N-acetyltransferase
VPAAILRPAQPADGEAIAGIQLAAWQATYGELNPAMVAGLDVARTAANWARAAEDPTHRLRLAEYAGTPVGYAFSGPAEDKAEGIGELHAVYLLPTAHGLGIGRLLVHDALAELARDGYTGCVAWVVERNAHARGFYEHVGFRADGARDEWRGLAAVRYRTALTADPA